MKLPDLHDLEIAGVHMWHGDTSALAGGVGGVVPGMEGEPEIDDAEHEHEEERGHDRELDGGGAVLAPKLSGGHGDGRVGSRARGLPNAWRAL